MQQIGSNEYSGHVGSGGLQGHSVGGLYPWIIYGTGGGTFGVMNGATGQDTGAVFTDYPVAGEWAERFKGDPIEFDEFMDLKGEVEAKSAPRFASLLADAIRAWSR
jgi:hypothetical protein